MNWIIVLIVSIIAIGISAWAAIEKYSDFGFFGGLVGILASVISLMVILVGVLQTPQSVNNFTKQKAYIEMHEAKNAVEDAALTSKKIELNEWLYDAQCSKSRFGGWSFYPDSIFDLEPIQ